MSNNIDVLRSHLVRFLVASPRWPAAAAAGGGGRVRRIREAKVKVVFQRVLAILLHSKLP